MPDQQHSPNRSPEPETDPLRNSPDSLNPSRVADRVRGLAHLVDTLLFGNAPNGHGAPPTLPVRLPDPPATEAIQDPQGLVLDGPDAMLVLDRRDGTIVEMGLRLAEWAGVSRDELIGTPFLDLFPESERKAARTLYEDAGAGGVHVIELNCTKPGGRSRLIEFTSHRTSHAFVEYAVVAGRDVGERAATERYLRAERDRLNLFIRAMRDVLVLVSQTGDILYANLAAEQNFEPYELSLVCHRWLNEFAKQHAVELQGHASAYGGQTLELEDNNARIFLVTRSFLFDSGRQPTVMLVAKDITEQKRMEKHNLQLEIQYMRESKLAEFGMLSAGIAHNLNGPLQVILGYCDLLDISQPGLAEVSQMREQALAMRDIIANLMQKSRNEQENQPREVHLEEVIRSELRFLEANLFFKHSVKTVVDIQRDTPPLTAIYIDLSQVVGNLLRNAIDAMRESPIRILTVSTQNDSKSLTLIVADTGKGMTEEVRRNLFTPFFTTKPKSSEAAPGEPTGTGLGLSSCRNILARYGASIAVQTEVGRGTSFTVSFPLNRKPVVDNTP